MLSFHCCTLPFIVVHKAEYKSTTHTLFLPIWLTLHYTQTISICQNLEQLNEKANIKANIKEELSINFTLEFQRDPTQFCIISRGESLFSREYIRIKSNKSKNSTEFFRKLYPQPSCLHFFWNGAIHSLTKSLKFD